MIPTPISTTKTTPIGNAAIARGARRARRAFVRLLWAVAVSSAAFGDAGCYDPKVVPGLLRCADPPAKQCPDGFSCANGVCVTEGGGTGTGGMGGRGGSGGASGGAGGASCAGAIAQLCTTPAGAPAGCDPVCQTGCACGLRCNVTTTAGPSCAAPIGARGVGDICDPNGDQCAPGFVCLLESCGTNLGRCYRYCRDGSMCGTNGVCGQRVDLPSGGDTGQRACNLGDYSCDAFLRTNCPDPAFSCFVTGPGHSTCDCPSGMNRALGETCVSYNDCAPGLACFTVGGATTCHKLCRNATDCAGCMSLGTAGGICP